jgi:hypothetical protein
MPVPSQPTLAHSAPQTGGETSTGNSQVAVGTMYMHTGCVEIGKAACSPSMFHRMSRAPGWRAACWAGLG